jgi:hypothetical protein
MTAKIYQFKNDHGAFTINLYTNEEIDVTIKAVNMFSNIGRTITKKSLPFIDPLNVINCLNMARINYAFFTVEEHDLCRKILETVDRIALTIK